MKYTFLLFIIQATSIILLSCENTKETKEIQTSLGKDTSHKKEDNNSSKLKNIPSNAIYGGHLDGGFWFEFVKNYDNLKYRFRIYNDYNGKLVLDADFLVNKNKKLLVNSEKDIDNILFMFKYLKINEIDLKPVYPAYGGAYWETVKKNGF
jgi:hypothetical protein